MKSRLKLSRLLLTCGVGVSMQLLAGSLELPLFGPVIQTALADGEGDQPENKGASTLNLALADQYAEYNAQACEAAKRRMLEVAPELLALASWPLDDHEPAECMGLSQVAALENPPSALEDAIEITDFPPVVSVIATTFGEKLPVARASTAIPSVNLDETQPPLGQSLAALDTSSLDEIRGGFELEGSGLKFSFGIERAVFINGTLIATTTMNIKDLQVTAGGSSAANALSTGSTGALGIIQNGAGNNVITQINPNVAGTVIQNTLNDQKIQNVTTINATVNSMQTLRTMSVQNAIQNGIVNSLRR